MTGEGLLFVFVEGPDDTRFLEQAFKHYFDSKYGYVMFIEYASLSNVKLNDWVETARGMDADLLWLRDLDNAPCATYWRSNLVQSFRRLSVDEIIIVKQEIESWYLAGASSDVLSVSSGHRITNTENIDKEQFRRLMPDRFIAPIDFMVEILKTYSLERGAGRNGSLEYFQRKLAY